MKKIAIIGGGISGLAAGIYARKFGYECDIYERHTIPGGQCTAWKRKGYTIDNCVHWMTGTSETREVYQVWKEVGVLTDGIDIIRNESFMRIQYQGQTLDLWRDPEDIRKNMLEIAPDEEEAINTFIEDIKIYQLVEVGATEPFEMKGIWEVIKLIFSLRKLGKRHKVLSRVSPVEYAEMFKHPLLKLAVTAYIPENYNVSSWLYVLATFTSNNGDIPCGGSAGITNRMVEKFCALGGNIHCGKEAIKIEHQGFHANKVLFKDGSSIEADYFICACDVSVTFNQLLGKEHIDDYFKSRFIEKIKHPIYTSYNVYFGVDGTTNFLPDTTWIQGNEFNCCGKSHNSFLIKSYASEPSFSPEGKNLIQVLLTQFEDDYDKWKDLYDNNRDEYKAEKKRVAESIQANIEKEFPQLAGKMEIVEMVSPVSFNRFCGAYKGAYMSWVLTPFVAKKIHKGHIRHLKNVFLAGQWLQSPGGLPNAVVTGKFAIQRIRKQEKLPYKI